MSMSDCAKCWDTPCGCGWDYRHMTREARIEFAAVVLGVKPGIIDPEMVPVDHPMKEKK